MDSEPPKLFGSILEFSNLDARDRLQRLIGLEEQKNFLAKTLELLIAPNEVLRWQKKHHPSADKSMDYFIKRPPLVVLAGDVGTGKTELAETIADQVARSSDIAIMLYPLTLSARGSGHVGEMTQLIDAAFSKIEKEATKLAVKNNSEPARGAVILLIDEADALAQSREENQMHHEDRAGVNALIRGIDGLSRKALPAAVIMNTNRLTALDPAIKRRAAEILEFVRPSDSQRKEAFDMLLKPFGISDDAIKKCVVATGQKGDERNYGATYSDLTQKFFPKLILAAYPDKPISNELAIEQATQLVPTKPFEG